MTANASTAAKAALDLIDTDIEAARSLIESLEAHIETQERERELAARRYEAAIAAEASGSIPVGTVVRHHRWPEVTGVVIPSDGTGLAVRQDGTPGVATYGFGPDEWVPVD